MKKIFLFVLLYFQVASYSEFSVITYNAGLAHTYVPYASERLPYIVDAIRKRHSDILCLQEVWREEDRTYLIDQLSDIYSYSHYEEIRQDYSSKKPACRLKEIFGRDKFVSCTLKKCKGKSGDDFTSCTINECQESLVRLKNENRQCAKALMAQVGKSSIQAIWAVINPFKAASLFSYDGGNGLLILSKKQLKNKSVIDMTDISTLSRRSALSADVPDMATVACTHLSADLDGDAPYAGDFKNWGEENKAQAERLVSNFRDRERTLLLGDFNCGQENLSLSISGELEESCELISDEFYDILSIESPSCTFCSENTLTSEENNIMIDHVFSSFDLRPNSVDVIYKDLVDFDGIQSNLSDHYGVEVKIDF